jgi:hypothetical protein
LYVVAGWNIVGEPLNEKKRMEKTWRTKDVNAEEKDE